jgi:putative transposase
VEIRGDPGRSSEFDPTRPPSILLDVLLSPIRELCALCLSEPAISTESSWNSMPRMARVVCPGVPHHITQRGVRRFDVFLDEADHQRYLELLRQYAPQFGLGITGYCVMTNHVHVVGIPDREDSIAKVFRDCHGIYAAEFNKKYGKTGHVWQARPFSCVLDEAHSLAAIRYVERNPVRARMVARAEDYPWSSARTHCGIAIDPLVRNSGGESLIADWSAWLAEGNDNVQEQQIRARTFTGRPCGDDEFVRTIEATVGRPLAPKKPGPKPRDPRTIETPLFPNTVDRE